MLRALPSIIADNAGFDSSELIARLRARHHKDGTSCSAGINIDTGEVGDMKELGITGALQSKMQVLVSAHEAAEMIMRVDSIVSCAQRVRTPHHH
jgi:T-complex protein 1 subunit beta